MEIKEAEGSNGKGKYEVTIEERRLEDLKRLNKLERRDEKPFEVVAEVSAIGEKVYCLCVRPFVRSLVNKQSAELGRRFHPLRWQRWAFSDLNPWLWPLPALAASVKAGRRIASPENPYRRAEKSVSELVIAGLNLFRDVRDATLESLFFQLYGPAAILGAAEETTAGALPAVSDPRELPIVRNALAAIGRGGYPEAIALMGALIGRGAGRIPLERLEMITRFVRSDDVLSKRGREEVRRIKAEQAVVAELEPERGLNSLPKLLADPKDRRRALALLDKAIAAAELKAEQRLMVDRVRAVLSTERAHRKREKHESDVPEPAAAV
jgi:hypothetical protein